MTKPDIYDAAEDLWTEITGTKPFLRNGATTTITFPILVCGLMLATRKWEDAQKKAIEKKK